MAKVIVDTSVWVDFFNGKLSESSKESLVALMDTNQMAITDIIRHEILVGSRNESDFLKLSELLVPIREYQVTLELRSKLDRFGFELRKKGLRGKYTDLTIAFLAHHHELSVCSFDKYFSRLARKSIIKIISL